MLIDVYEMGCHMVWSNWNPGSVKRGESCFDIHTGSINTDRQNEIKYHIFYRQMIGYCYDATIGIGTTTNTERIFETIATLSSDRLAVPHFLDDTGPAALSNSRVHCCCSSKKTVLTKYKGLGHR